MPITTQITYIYNWDRGSEKVFYQVFKLCHIQRITYVLYNFFLTHLKLDCQSWSYSDLNFYYAYILIARVNADAPSVLEIFFFQFTRICYIKALFMYNVRTIKATDVLLAANPNTPFFYGTIYFCPLGQVLSVWYIQRALPLEVQALNILRQESPNHNPRAWVLDFELITKRGCVCDSKWRS